MHKKTILLEGPFLSQSGYGYQARFALEAILSSEEYDVYIINVGWGKSSSIKDQDYIKKIDALTRKTTKLSEKVAVEGQYFVFDIFLHIGILNEMPERTAKFSVSYTAGVETTKVSYHWINKLNQINRMIVPSKFSKNVFEITKYIVKDDQGNQLPDLKCETPIDVVNYGIKEVEPEPVDLKLDYDFNFLSVALWSPRKNMSVMIESFLEEFYDEEVGLILKTGVYNNSYKDRKACLERINGIAEMIKFIKEDKPMKCKIYLLHGDLTEGQMKSLYQNPKIKAYVTTAHGEGYGLPIFEAAVEGMPVISPGWSGELDFLTIDGQKYFRDMKYELHHVPAQAVYEKVIEKDAQWCYVKKGDVKSAMRDMVTSHSTFKEKADHLKEHLHKFFIMQDKYAEFCQAVNSACEVKQDEIEEWLKSMELVE